MSRTLPLDFHSQPLVRSWVEEDEDTGVFYRVELRGEPKRLLKARFPMPNQLTARGDRARGWAPGNTPAKQRPQPDEE